MGNFVKTSDSNTAENLRKAGFTELGKEGNMFVFVNNGKKLTFTEDDKKKMIMTNIACL